MADIKKLIDRKTGRTIYPQTIAKAIYDSYGKDLQTRLDELNQDYVATSAQSLTDEQKVRARINIGVNGIAVKSIKNVSINLNASELPVYLASLPRLLTDNYYINLTGTCSQIVYLNNFYGCGKINLCATNLGDCVFTKNIIIENCSIPVIVEKLKWTLDDEATDSTYCIDCISSNMRIFNCSFNGYVAASETKTGNGVTLAYNSSVILSNCAFHDLNIAAHTYLGGYINISCAENLESDYSGNRVGVYLYYGGLVLLGDYVPDTLGGIYNEKNGINAIIKNGKFI